MPVITLEDGQRVIWEPTTELLCSCCREIFPVSREMLGKVNFTFDLGKPDALASGEYWYLHKRCARIEDVLGLNWGWHSMGWVLGTDTTMKNYFGNLANYLQKHMPPGVYDRLYAQWEPAIPPRFKKRLARGEQRTPERHTTTGERVPRCQVCERSLVHEPLADICIVWPYTLGPESGKYSLLHKPCFARHDQAAWGCETLDRFLNPLHGYTRKIPRPWVEAFARFWPPSPQPQRKTPQAPRSSKTGSVYIIEALGTAHYKIGYGINALERLRALQTGCPFPLRLLRDIRIADNAGLEQRLHARYAHYRRLGEWFELPPAVLEHLLQEKFQ